MSTPTHAVAERSPGRSRGRDKPPPRPETPTAGPLQVSIHQLDLIATQSPDEARAHALLDLALAEPAQSLPYATVLEQRFGRPLGWVQVRSGPLVRDTLAALGAQAATRGDTVFLRDRSAPLDVVAHEVTHALQGRNAADPTAAAGVVPENAPAEAEAAVVASGHSAPATLRSPVRPAEGLAPSAIALLRPAPEAAADPAISLEPVASSPAPSIAAPTAATPAAPTVAPNALATPAAGPVTEPGAGTLDSGEALALPASTELTVSPEEVAARETAMAEAAAALASAGSAGDLLHAYADAAPTVKAQQAAALSSHLNTAVAGETQEWQTAVPELEAHLPGETGPAPTPLQVDAPPATAVVLEPDAVAPAPVPELPDAPAVAPFTANDRVSGALAQLTAPPPEQLADTIGDTLSQVQTSDPSLPRTPGPPPPIPLGGETDPARIAGQAEATTTQAAAVRDDAARAIVDGPGPEQVQPVAVQQAYAVEAVEPPAPAPLVAPPGPDAYLALNLPPEVATAFDEQQQAAMQESMATATAKADEVTVARDAARDAAVSTAEAGAAELNQKAEHDQTAAVTDARSTIQTERQSSIDAQHAEVGRIKTDVAERRRADEEQIDTRVQAEQQEIDKSYAKSETDIANQVAEGERKAAAEREKAERDAENESWWDRAVSFVKDAFNALVSAIGDIFDAVRQAVNAALDALKAFALSVIDRVASFIKDAIALYGEFLKFAVDTLIGTFFPELAAKLNAAIDTAVAKAQAAVDVVANGLKAGISALVEGLRAGINAALDAYEAGLSLAVSFVAAALTGDWGMLAKKVLEGVLRLIGVDPETFYAFVGRAQETFDIIINDPMGFLSNLVSAVVGGVQGFADRFGEHLKKGVIGWLTGTLGGAGITLPATFDLMGVLDLARQILGLTWERLRAKAVKLIGEKNVARLEFIGGYITTLINEGWSGLWNKIMADLSGLLDMVFDGIKSFLLERVVLAMIKKIPALFGPVGAIVQLVMTAWNLYTFLRDKLASLVALVQSVVDSIGDIARGVLTAAVAKVEQVLGNLVPLALDLLARILGLGNVGEDVKKIIEKVQAFIDKAIDGLINKVIGLFTGKGKGGPAPAGPAADNAAGPADPEVKSKALTAARQRISKDKLESVEALHSVVATVYQEFKPRGLAALWFDVTNETTLDGRLLAAASEPEQLVVGWHEIFDPLDPEKVLFETQPRNETQAAISVAGQRVGAVQASDKDHHAEQNLVAAHWDEAIKLALSLVTPGNKVTLAVAINRAPCHQRCSPFLTALLQNLDPAVKGRIKFILAPTGVYEPTEALTPEAIAAQRKELTDVAVKLGRPASAVIREQLNKVVLTEDTTTMSDLQKLVAVGWDLRQLQARKTQTTAGRILAEAAHKVAQQAEDKAKAGAK